MTVRLIPLDCPSCGSALHGEPEDSLFLCAHCGVGAVLETERLVPVRSTALLPTPGRQVDRWRPGWLLEVDVTVSGRTTADGRSSPPSSARRGFVVPAFALPLPDLCRLARALSQVAGATAEVPHEPVPGGRLQLGDALTFVRHLVVGEEVGRPDLLATVEVSVVPADHRVVALPFARDGQRLRCAVTGVSVEPGR